MAGLYEVEVEPEVKTWLARLSDRDFGRVDFHVGLLAEHAENLGEPYTAPRRQGPRTQVPPPRPADPHHVLARPRTAADPAHRLPQDPQRRGHRGRPCITSPEDLRSRARTGPRHLRPRG